MHLDLFTAATPVKEKSDVECLQTLGHGILQFVTEQKQILASILDGDESVETFIDAQRTKVADNKQEWLAKSMVGMVVGNAQQQNLKFAHAYLKDVTDGGAKATVRVAVCHGVVCSKSAVDEEDEYAEDMQPQPEASDDGEMYQYTDSSITSETTYQNVGGMEFDINLPCGGVIANPLHNEEVNKYLIKEWIGKMSLFAGHIVRAASCAKEAYIDDTNQSSEGIIRWMTLDNDFKTHLKCLAMMMIYLWDKHVKTDNLFATQAAGLESLVQEEEHRRAKKKLKLNDNSEAPSDDAAMLAKEDTVDSAWGKKGFELRVKLNASFVAVGNLEHRTKQCNALTSFGLTMEPPIAFMSYPSYLAFMNGKRTSKKPLDRNHIEVMDAYVDKVNTKGGLMV